MCFPIHRACEINDTGIDKEERKNSGNRAGAGKSCDDRKRDEVQFPDYARISGAGRRISNFSFLLFGNGNSGN